jgi:D-lyxose ketol-isomerase
MEKAMQRSVVNAIMRDVFDFFHAQGFHLPPFATWTPDDWHQRGAEASEIVKNGLGWDITDYGLGDFQRYGLLLFTLRNGSVEGWRQGKSKPYCEKLMIAEVGQEHQMHFHWKKVEDIINRAGGRLAIRLYNAGTQDKLANTDVVVSVDGMRRTLPAGEVLWLGPGESVTLTPRLYHKFWAENSRVIMGEVSTINDDSNDNHFFQPFGSGRFSTIEEDEPPLYLLSSDYSNYWNSQAGGLSFSYQRPDSIGENG